MNLGGMKIGQTTLVEAGHGYKFKNKQEQIKALTEFINDMAEQRIHNENGEDWKEYKEQGRDDVEDQLSGISGMTVNGKEVRDIFHALMEGLSHEDMQKAAHGLKYSTWKPGDDYHYIWEGL